MSESNGKPKSRLSPEARDKLSRLAKERHARGEIGGAKYGKLGGRPKKDRAAKGVAEAAQEDINRRNLVRVFRDAIDPSQPMSLRLKGAEAWLSIESQEAKLSLQESEMDAKQHSRDELIQILAERLTSGPSATILQKTLTEQVIDAEVVPDDDG